MPASDRAVTLHLVRHAHALEHDASGDDAQRMLSPKGVRQTALLDRALRARGVGLGLLASSPRRRAVQTAAGLDLGATLQVVDALDAGDPEAIVRALRAELPSSGGGDAIAVGHQPSLSQLTAFLLTGSAEGASVAFGTATIATFTGALGGGGMTLVSLVPMQLTRALLGAASETADDEG
ncbi:hypothetical protein BH23DEI1_BH23DEI1_14870 [soil metagenome]